MSLDKAMVSPEQPSRADYRTSVDNQTVNCSKEKAPNKKSVHLSAISTSSSMDPPSPPPPPLVASGVATSRSTAGEKSNQSRRPAPPAPVLLRIDASAQGFHSGGNSPLDSSPVSFQVTQSGAGHQGYPAAPVQVTARFSSPKGRPGSGSGTTTAAAAAAAAAEVHHHHSHYHQQNTYHHQPEDHQPQQFHHHQVPPAAAPAAFVTMPGQTAMLPVFTSPTAAAAASAMPPQQAAHYYTSGHHQAAYPTMVPFHMPGSYAVAGYTPAMVNTIAGAGIDGGNGGVPSGGEVLIDPVMASHAYQAAQYHAMMQQFMQHNLNMQQQQQQALGNAVASGGGGGGGRTRGGGGSAAAPSYPYQDPNHYQSYQNQQHGGMAYPSSSYHVSNHQPTGNTSRGGGNGNGGSFNSSYPTSFTPNSNDIALPGVSEGPEAEIFQAAIRESGALSSYERSSAAAGGGGEGSTNEFLSWVRKTLATLDGGLGGGAHAASAAAPPTASSSLVLSLEEMRGNLVALSRDQIGSRVLQTAMEGMNEDDLKLLFEELQPKLEILMADQFGNYVIQRLLESRVESIIMSIGESLKGRVLPFALHVYGCRVVQKALDALPQEHRVELAVELQPFTLHCLSDQNANHVIQKCLETVQPIDGVREMLETIAKHALTLARHSFGCRAVQRLLQYCSIPEVHDGVIDDVLSSILELTKNQFGNYVVQHLVAQGPEDARNAIMEVILPLSASLACHKFASNVMETCLQQCPDEQRSALIAQLIQPSDRHAPTLAAVARDQFGNYVLQRALEVATEEEKWQLVMELQPHLEGLRRSGYGKHIASRVSKMLIGMARQKQQQHQQHVQEEQQQDGAASVPFESSTEKEGDNEKEAVAVGDNGIVE